MYGSKTQLKEKLAGICLTFFHKKKSLVSAPTLPKTDDQSGGSKGPGSNTSVKDGDNMIHSGQIVEEIDLRTPASTVRL